MRKFKLLTKDGYIKPFWEIGKIYDENFIGSGSDYTVGQLQKHYPQDWQEVFGEEKVQLTETEKIVLIDFLNDHFEDLGEFINGVNTSDQNYNNLEGRWSYNKISNLIDKIEKL